MRSARDSDYPERIAEIVFFAGLFLLTLVVLVMVYELA
jgi:hypothetical protein